MASLQLPVKCLQLPVFVIGWIKTLIRCIANPLQECIDTFSIYIVCSTKQYQFAKGMGWTLIYGWRFVWVNFEWRRHVEIHKDVFTRVKSWNRYPRARLIYLMCLHKLRDHLQAWFSPETCWLTHVRSTHLDISSTSSLIGQNTKKIPSVNNFCRRWLAAPWSWNKNVVCGVGVSSHCILRSSLGQQSRNDLWTLAWIRLCKQGCCIVCGCHRLFVWKIIPFLRCCLPSNALNNIPGCVMSTCRQATKKSEYLA